MAVCGNLTTISPTILSTNAFYLLKRTVSFHNFKSQNFKLSVSNPESRYVAYLSVLSQISNCQGLGRKNKHEILKSDRNNNNDNNNSNVITTIISLHYIQYCLFITSINKYIYIYMLYTYIYIYIEREREMYVWPTPRTRPGLSATTLPRSRNCCQRQYYYDY